MSVVVPDKVMPEIGWRVWSLTDGKGFVLHSPLHQVEWLPGEPAVARCSPSQYGTHRAPTYVWQPSDDEYGFTVEGAASHVQQSRTGTYPIYLPPPPRVELPAGRRYKLVEEAGEESRAAPYGHTAPHKNCNCGFYAVSTPDRWARGDGPVSSRLTENTVIGRVALWGKVVPGEKGWRGEYAYPHDFFVITQPRNHGGFRLRRRTSAEEKLAEKLEVYGVPVRIIGSPLELLNIEEREGVAA